MRILEKCTSSWPMPDMQQQIDALREAFSADIRKPFVLKPSFPYGSPKSLTTSPQRGGSNYRQTIGQGPSQQGMEQQHVPQQQVSHISHPISPPVSARHEDTKSDSPPVQLISTGQREVALPQGVHMPDTSAAWNPSRIFE